jgi:transcriptional regulator with XRE-family HTH domain
MIRAHWGSYERSPERFRPHRASARRSAPSAVVWVICQMTLWRVKDRACSSAGAIARLRPAGTGQRRRARLALDRSSPVAIVREFCSDPPPSENKEPAMSDTSRHDSEHALAKLGRALREARERQGIREHDLAAAIGITLEDMRALEDGKLDPDYELLIALADGLGCKPSSLIIRAQDLGLERRAPRRRALFAGRSRAANRSVSFARSTRRGPSGSAPYAAGARAACCSATIS